MSAEPAAVSSSVADHHLLFRQVMGRFATGVTVITTCVGEEPFGMTANAFMAGSLEPMLCVVSINRAAQMHGRLLQAGHYGVSFLTQLQQHFAAHFAGRRLHGLTPEFEFRGRTPILKRSLAAATAEVAETVECGDHTLFIGRINDLVIRDAARPLLFFGGRYAWIDVGTPIADAVPPEFW